MYSFSPKYGLYDFVPVSNRLLKLLIGIEIIRMEKSPTMIDYLMAVQLVNIRKEEQRDYNNQG
jgi:hypothetical protein